MDSSIASIIKRTWSILKASPYIWILIFLASIGDLWAIFTYDPYFSELPKMLLLVSIYTFITETSILYAITRHDQNQTSDLIDSLMSSLTSPATIGAKAILLILPALLVTLFITFLIIIRTFLTDFQIFGLLIILFLPFLLIIQVWTPFTSCGILFHQYSMPEAILHAWRIIQKHIWTIIKIIGIFFTIDLVLIFCFLSAGGFTYESTFIKASVIEIEDLGEDGQIEIYTMEKDEVVFNRPMAGFLTSILGTRGINLQTIPIFSFENKFLGLIYILISAIILPFRISVLAFSYNLWAEPVPILNQDEIDFWKHRNSPHIDHNM